MNRYGIRAVSCGLWVWLLMTGGANAQSAVRCDNYARSFAQNNSAQGQVLGSTAVGSLVGLGIGAIAGGAGVGAAIGAGVGLIGGGARRQQTFQQMYNAAFQDCMAGRVR